MEKKYDIEIVNNSVTTLEAHRSTDEIIKHKEGGYGWFVLFSATIVLGFVQSTGNNYSLTNNELIKIYNHTENNVVYAAWIGSTLISAEFLFASISCVLVDIIGARKMAMLGGFLVSIGFITSAFVKNLLLYFLTISLCVGLGQSMVKNSLYSIIPQYFNKRLGLATGLMTFGACALTVTTPLLVAYLFEIIGLEKTFYVMGAMYALVIILAISFKPILPTRNLKDIKLVAMCKESTKISILKNPDYLLWIISSMFAYYGSMIIAILITHYSAVSFPGEKHELLNVSYSTFVSISSIVFGRLNDYWKYSHIYFHVLSSFIYGIIEILMAYAPNFTSLCVYMGFIGIADGIYYTALMTICQDIFQSSRLVNQAMGYFNTFMLLPIIAAPIVGAAMYEALNSYTLAFLHGGLTLIICGIMQIFYPSSITVRLIKEYWSKRSKKSSDEFTHL